MKNLFLNYSSEKFSTRVSLGLLDASHATFLSLGMNDPEMRDYLLSNNFPVSVQSEESWIGSLYQRRDDITLGVFLKDTEEIVGVMGLHKIDFVHRNAVTGAWLGSSFRGKDYGFEAKMLLLNYAFNTLNLHKIQSFVFETNERSAAYSMKCGYKEEARFKNHVFKNGKYIDDIVLAVFKEDFDPIWNSFIKK